MSPSQAGAGMSGNATVAGTAGGGLAGAASLGGRAGAGGVGGVGGAIAGASSCEPTPEQLVPWPGRANVTTLDMPDQFQSDLSGLTFEAASGALWAVNNLSSKLFRLLPQGAGYVPDTANGWSDGKLLRYPSGKGAPDSEGVTLGKDLSDGVFACAEHDADDSGTSRLSVLRYDVVAAGAATSLTATHEWNLTALLPPVGANLGLEAISWLPDDYLVLRGFFDEGKQAPYEPESYPDHGTGLFVVGVEQTGTLYVLALDRAKSSASLIATVATPNPGVMGLEFDRDNSQLRFNCDDTCGNESGILDIDTRATSATRGRFVVRRQFQRPSGLPDSNNEGIAIGSACDGGYKPLFWTDDADAKGYSLRQGSIPCAACF